VGGCVICDMEENNVFDRGDDRGGGRDDADEGYKGG